MSVTFDPTSEQVVLAAALNDSSERRKLVRMVASDDCYADRHRIIWSILREMDAHRLDYDVATFAKVASGLGFTEREWGGDSYLEDLVGAYPDDANVEWHARQARVESRCRSIADQAAVELVDELRKPGVDPTRVVSIAREILTTASSLDSSDEGPTLTGSRAGSEYREILGIRRSGKSDNVPIGLGEVDEHITWGLLPGKVTILAGRPSNGKSSFSYNVMKWWADRCMRGDDMDPRPALICSLEMGRTATQDAIVSRASGVPVDKIVKTFHMMDMDEQTRVASSVSKYVESPWLEWFDEPGASIDRIAEVIAMGSEEVAGGTLRSKYGLVVWDLFDKSLPDLSPSSISEGLNKAQAIAKEFGTHLLLLAQIRRGVERRGDKRPTREDLKGSGGWEEVADQIIAVHRESVYDPDLEDDTMEIGILKQRMGPFGTWFTYDYNASTFMVGGYRGASDG